MVGYLYYLTQAEVVVAPAVEMCPGSIFFFFNRLTTCKQLCCGVLSLCEQHDVLTESAAADVCVRVCVCVN